MPIKIGTRGSKLAVYQAERVKKKLEEINGELEAEIIIIKTKGDKILDVPLARIGDKGLFIKEIENALIDGKIDIGVHSVKDIPTALPAGLTLSTFLSRGIPNDAFISNKYRSIEDLPSEAVVGTGSLRRKSQILALRDDVVVKDLRGNVETRLKKLDDGVYDAIILAAAGMKRLGLDDRITQLMPIDIMVPAVGQGVIGIESCEDNNNKPLLSKINHEETKSSVLEERAFLRKMEGGCQVPIGCYGRFEGNRFILIGFVGTIDGKKIIRHKIIVNRNDVMGTGLKLAAIILNRGGSEILKEIDR